jgi:glycosyltransferase involved in cell wall biosynthesis
MRVAYLNLLASPEQAATGVRTSYMESARALAARGHEVTVLTSGEYRTWHQGDIRLVQLGAVRPYASGFDLLDPGFVSARMIYMARATRWVRRNAIDLLEVSEAGLEQAFLLFRRPCAIVSRLHGNVSQTQRSTHATRFLEKLEAIATRASDGISSPSEGYAEMIAEAYGIPRQAIRIIPNSIDRETLLKSAAPSAHLRDRWGLGDRRIVLFSGTLSERKGAPVLHQVAASFDDRDDVVFAVVGSGGLELPISQLQNVIATGELDRQELCGWYRAADLFFLPSHFENMSMSILEALTFGLPVVALDVGGNSDLIIDGVNGCLVPGSEVENITEILVRMLEDSAALERLKVGARETSCRYDSSEIAPQLEAFFGEIIDHRNNAYPSGNRHA